MSAALAASAVALRVLVTADPAAATVEHERFDARVAELAQAVAWCESHAAEAGRFEIVLAPGVHAALGSVRIPAAVPALSIVGQQGARVVGGIVEPKPAWVEADAAVLARVPDEARAHIRAWRLPASALARLAGPVHSGHGVAVAAVHSELVVDGRPLELARWPNEGFAEIGELIDPGSVPRDGWDDVPAARRVKQPDRGGVFVPADRVRPMRWKNEADLWALGFWNWDWSHEQLPIAKVDADTGAVTLARPHTYGLAKRGKFFVRNALSELDREGEYWIDRAEGVVYAWLPEHGEAAEAGVTLAGEPLIVLEGVRDAAIAGIAFSCTRGAVIAARACSGLRIEDCAFSAVGARAVELDGTGNVLARCDFRDIGGTGALLTGGDRPTLARGDSAIEDCRFRECGRVLRSYSPAVVVEGVGNRVSRCAITRHPHIALWFRGNDHLIEANEFSEVVYETGDAGAIYVGRDWTAQGTVVRANLFHDIRGSDARFQNAVYLDDMSSGITVEDNVFVRCNWGVLVGGGRDNTLRRNTFVACEKAVSWDARGVGWMAKEIEDPTSSTLLRTYAAMPVASEPWKSRYPHLGDYLTFDFGRPVRGVFAGNRLIGTPLGRIDDRERVIESGTVSEAAEGGLLDARAAEAVASAQKSVGPRVAEKR